MNHDHYLRIALEQAKLGRGHCAPNPCVGAVAVRSGEVLAKGFHTGPGAAHAERVVLSQLNQGLTEVTLYVTLEPCNHWGRTPPCVDAILDYGIKQVVYAYADPNPLVVQNCSVEALKAHGISVQFHPLAEINAFYESYAYWIQTQKPFVTVKLAQSLDGKIAGESGKPVMLSNVSCARFTHEHRASTDCILTTAETILKDSPAMTARLDGEETGKVIAILDRNLRLPADALVFQKARTVLVYHDEVHRVSNPVQNSHYIPIPVLEKTNQLDLNLVFQELGQRGMHDVWVEAGARLFNALHLEERVQRTYLYFTPHVLGSKSVGAYMDEAVFQRRHSVSWRVFEDNGLLCLDWS